MSARTGDWIQTATGGQFWPMDPQPEEIDINDIAHALSMLCRFGGHCLRFYSVAEHSVLLSYVVAREHALWALMHDATEGYLVDMPRPIKAFLPGYKEAEAGIERAVAAHFGLTLPVPAEVKDADKRILTDEAQQNMAHCPVEWATAAEPLGVRLQFWSPTLAKAEFLARYRELTGDAS
ncbi:phosphohydrolase [Bosea sp. NPDC055332]